MDTTQQRSAASGLRLLLFDVDGTLLKTGGAGSRAMNRVFLDRFGIVDAFAAISPDGKTDPILFKEMLEAAGRGADVNPELIGSLQHDYEACFAESMASSPGAVLMPGVENVLERLSTIPDVVLGLLTGNFEVTARLKIGHFGLNRYFEFGSFGSDSAVREELVRPALDRAAKHLRIPIPADRRTYIIGDTPRDVACALANGVTSVGVATGNYSSRQLSDAGAHIVLDDLSDTESVVEVLTRA